MFDIQSPLIGMGSFAFIFRIAEDRILKRAKIYQVPNPDPLDVAYSNYVNRGSLENEKTIYERLGSHHGIIDGFKPLDDSIELAFANHGDLEKYIQENISPSRTFRAEWIRSLVDVYSYIHSRRVIIDDIALRNILVHKSCLKLCDFGNSSLLPLNADMQSFCENNTTPQVEILHVGFVLYSIAVWQVFKYDYFDNDRFPEADELPVLDGVLFANLIKKCLNGEYASMEALRSDLG